MAPATAPGLTLQDLSSNWRNLQEKLKADTSKPPKRPAAVLQDPQQPTGRKKPRLNGPTSKTLPNPKVIHKRSKMGMGWSSSSKKEAPSASLALWAEDNDIPAASLAAAYGTSLKSTSIPDFQKDSKDSINAGLSTTLDAGKYIAIDCEMVGVGPNPDDSSVLARVSIVNYHGHQLYDSFVAPKEAVTDYRTFVSGITEQLLAQARTLEEVLMDVAGLLEGRILVGHGIRNDLDAIMLGHPRRDIRDTSRHPPFRQLAGGKTPSLKKLAREVLGVDIQGGEHSSVEDARATMLLLRREKKGFEREHLSKWGADKKVGEVATQRDGEEPKAKSKKKKKKKKTRK